MRLTLLALTLLTTVLQAAAQTVTVAGKIAHSDTRRGIEFASVLLKENGLWAITDSEGRFAIKNVPTGRATMTVQCLGYSTRTLQLNIVKDMPRLDITLEEENLKLQEVTVVAKRKQDEATTSYTIDRQTLDQQQMLNVSDIGSLLPGGKTVNATLMEDNRLSLRSNGQEKGNASFGTAIEIDGMRLDNNATAGETLAASTRTISASNIESVEVVTGIPSVEYGDLSNGVVKVNTRKGKSPFIVEGKLNQHTRQIAVNKGFDLGSRWGVLNASFEHARSFSDAASPYTAYQRNILSLNYMNTFFRQQSPLTLNVGLSGNVGGYNSKADPDRELDSYAKSRDNVFRGNISLQWLLNKSWITNLSLRGTFSYADHRTENYTNMSSASTQPYKHTTEQGYFMAEEYPSDPTANIPPIILSPTGYWYTLGFNDSKPLTWSLKLKADWSHRFGQVVNLLKVGADYSGSHNHGRGSYYDDMRYAPDWREYRYDQLPAMHNLALYIEDKVSVPTTRRASLELTAGVRDDITMIGQSDYGTVGSLSPRANARYIFWRNQQHRVVRSLEIHAGWGKSVKLPSFQILYPRPSYTDIQAFSSTSTADNKSYYAYYTYPQKAVYNPDLRWQYTNQTDLGLAFDIKGTRIAVSAFHHKTFNGYMSTRAYTPFTYRYTSPSAAQTSGIPVANRTFTIDRESGIVTVSDATGQHAAKALVYSDRNTYTVSQQYTNATPISRYGLEWTIDFATIRPLNTSVRLDGNYYYYKGTDDVLFADVPLGVTNIMSNGQPFQYVGYYRGSNVTSAGTSASAAVANGFLSKQANLNATITTHIPKIRLIVSLRIESSLYNFRRSLSQLTDGTRGYMLENGEGYFGEPYDGTSENKFVVVYPEYYSTWSNPDERIPFAEKFLWAKDNDRQLYNDLSQLVVRSNYAYTMNPNRLSAYYSANLSVTKEIGDHVSVSFYANNFFNNMGRVHSSQTDLETSLFGSGYIPSYYYGLSLRLKL